MHEPILRSLRASLLALAMSLILPSGASAAFIYDVILDTSTIAGDSGFVDLQFNPGGMDAAHATAMLSAFDLGGGSLSGAPQTDGNVNGILPGPVLFENSTTFNGLFQEVTFGGSLTFRIEFAGEFLSDVSSPGTTFSVGILGPEPDYPPLLKTGGLGDTASVLFELSSGGVTWHIYPEGDIQPVPEPHAWMLFAIGLAVLLATRSRLPAH
jgi:hypothetical protein